MSRPDLQFSRRVQLLLDPATYQRVADEAEKTGRSVNAVLREAISARYDNDEEAAQRRRSEAARQLLAYMEASSDEEPYDPADFDEDAYYENYWSREMKRLDAEKASQSS
ncbi:hypothetical protein [Nocardioides sp.]|uniref:hypothetical protein n=1 Tax=Nocardioides sp. TaxID=35761 RepID=UPI0039E3B845